MVRSYFPLMSWRAFGEPASQQTRRELDCLLDQCLQTVSPPSSVEGAFLEPRLNLRETDEAYHLSVELPGVEQKDIEVSLDDAVLLIRAQKHKEEEHKGENVHRIEHTHGKFYRSLQLPRDIDSDHVKAKYDKGILSLQVFKKSADATERKKITVT